MAQEFIEYKVVVDTSNGVAKFELLNKSIKETEKTTKELNSSVDQTSKKLAQAQSKAGLAGATVVELGRTISDANYGWTAMANNLSQLSTLMITLISTTGGVTAGFRALWSALMGPLGVIVVFQILISLVERFALNSRKSNEETKKLKNTTDALAFSVKNLREEEEKRLKLSKELSANQKQQLLTEQVLLEGQLAVLKQLSEGRKIADDISEFYDSLPKKMTNAQRAAALLGNDIEESITPPDKEKNLSEWDSQISEIEKRLEQIKKILYENAGADGKFELPKLDLVELIDWEYEYKQAEIYLDAYSKVYGELSDRIKNQLENAKKPAQEAINEFLESNAVIDAAEIKRRQSEEESAKLTAKWLGVIREEHIMTWQAVGDAMSSMSSILGEQTKAGKAIAVAGALIDTYSAIAKTLNAFAGKPIPGYAIAQSIAIGLFGMAQVKKILSVPVPGGKGGGSAGLMAAPTQAPTFNIVGTSGASQLREAVEGGLNRPIKAYVTQKDISTSAELERSTRKTASII